MVLYIRYISGTLAAVDLGEGSRIIRFEDFATTDGRVVDAAGAKRGLVVSKVLEVKRFKGGEPSYVSRPDHMLLVHDADEYDGWLASTVDEVLVDGVRLWPRG